MRNVVLRDAMILCGVITVLLHVSTNSFVDPRKQHRGGGLHQAEGTPHVELTSPSMSNEQKGTDDSGHQVMTHS